MPSRQTWAVVHCISLPDRRCARMADRELCAGGSSANTKLSSSSTLSQASVRTPPNGASIPKQVRSQRVAGVSGDSSSNKRGRMQTLKIAGVLALIFVAVDDGPCAGDAPGWQWSPGVRGERACRPTWPDVRDQSPPQTNSEQPRLRRGDV